MLMKLSYSNEKVPSLAATLEESYRKKPEK